jgi:hypothetical protein
MQHALLREYGNYLDDDSDSMTLFFMYSSYQKDMQEKKQAQELANTKRGVIRMPNNR